MPELGEIKSGKELGVSRKSSKFIWCACPDCGKTKWAVYVVKRGMPARTRCLSCATKLTFINGTRSKSQLTPEMHQHLSDSKKGKNNPNFRKYGDANAHWTGGRRGSDGYIRVWVHPDDFFFSMADVSKTVAEHRLVMAKHLGRCLLPWEVVHHINNDRSDNRLENLRLLSDRKYHMIDTQTKRYIRKLEDKIKKLESQLGEVRH